MGFWTCALPVEVLRATRNRISTDGLEIESGMVGFFVGGEREY